MAGCRRLMGETYLRQIVDLDTSLEELKKLPSSQGKTPDRFIQLRTVSEGPDKPPLPPPDYDTVIFSNYLHLRSNLPPDSPPPMLPQTPAENARERYQKEYDKVWRANSQRKSPGLKVSLGAYGLPVHGLKKDLLDRIVRHELEKRGFSFPQ